jgi:hypothetical protein
MNRLLHAPTWLRNQRVLLWLAVITGVIFSAPAMIIVPLLDNLLPGVVWWPGVWMAVLALSAVALIVWSTRQP